MMAFLHKIAGYAIPVLKTAAVAYGVVVVVESVRDGALTLPGIYEPKRA